MTIFTNGVFPAGGLAGDGGGIIQVAQGSRSGPVYYYSIGSSTYICACYADITPRDNTNKILINASLDGVANPGGSGSAAAGEWEAWLVYNANAPNGSTITAADQAVGGWTNIGVVTGLGAWNTTNQSIGSFNAHVLHSPATTNVCRYCIVVNRRSAVYFNNEFNTNPDAGGSDQGTTITLMEISR